MDAYLVSLILTRQLQVVIDELCLKRKTQKEYAYSSISSNRLSKATQFSFKFNYCFVDKGLDAWDPWLDYIFQMLKNLSLYVSNNSNRNNRK